jgi:transposase InsO family protein
MRNHLPSSVAVDFAVVPTLRFSLLYVFVVLDHSQRQILHTNATDQPNAAWAAQQLVEALPWDAGRRLLFRNGDGIYGSTFSRRAEGLGLQEIVSARASPWQNAYCERVIGTMRRECLDHIVAIDEDQLRRVVRAYVAYYKRTRTRLSL